MRKIILYIHSTFNGVITGDPKKDKDNFNIWTTDASNESGSAYLLKIMKTVDTILLGRGTYEGLNRAWPFIADWGPVSDTVIRLGEKVNTVQKVIVTGEHPLNKLEWGKFAAPTQLTGSDIEEQIKKLKGSDGGDIIIFGSPKLVDSLANADLIDEYQIQVHPVVVNYGEHLFDNLKNRKDFDLVNVEKLEDGGTMVVVYKPAETRTAATHHQR